MEGIEQKIENEIEIFQQLRNESSQLLESYKKINENLREVNTEIISEIVCKIMGTTLEKAKFRNRNSEAVSVRFMIAYILRLKGRWLSEIARFMNLHHTTIIHAINGAENLLSYNREYQNYFNKIKEEINL